MIAQRIKYERSQAVCAHKWLTTWRSLRETAAVGWYQPNSYCACVEMMLFPSFRSKFCHRH